ncbi:MAG: hypothetical protein Fur005_25720 [Roseiflexaceae bacterium]
MIWITRERPKVGRVGCSWLIRRFIDPQAEFAFADGANLMAEAQRLSATIYHVDGSELSRQGDSASFEVTARRYHLVEGDPALALLCQIVNTADIPRGPTQRPEGPGLRAVIDGLLLIEADDQQVLRQGWLVYDALYASCQDLVRRGRA